MNEFCWLATAGIELKVHGRTVLIDPFFSRFSLWKMWFGRVHVDHDLVAAKIQICDSVLVTHAHWDHIMDVPDVVHNTGAPAYGSPNCCQLLTACGVPEERIHEINVGDTFITAGLKIDVLRSVHTKAPGFSPGLLASDLAPPLRARDYRMDDLFSFLITFDGHSLLTDPGVRAEDAVPAEMLLVQANRDEDYYRALLTRVQPRVVIPYHWDDFFRCLSKPLRPSLKPPRLAWPPLRRINLAEFGRTIQHLAPEVRVFEPDAFRTYNLNDLF